MESLRTTAPGRRQTRVSPPPNREQTGQAIVDGPPDRVGRLPKAAADRLQRFIAASDNAFAIRASVSDARNQVLQERGRVLQQIARLDASREPPDSQAYINAAAERDRLDRVIDQLAQRLAPLDLNTVNLHSVNRAIDAMSDPIRLAMAPIIPDGDTADGVRARIGQLKAELIKVRNEPLSASERRQRVKAWIQARAAVPSVNAQGDINIPMLPPSRTKFADAFLTVNVGDTALPRVDGFVVNTGEDTLGMLLGLFPDVAEKAMTRDLPDGMPSEDRAMRVVDLLAAILDAERVDVVLSEQAAVPYRADTDVRALLGIE